MNYDLSAIMRRAWQLVRKANVAKHGLRTVLRNALRTAWREAKTRVAMAEWTPPQSGKRQQAMLLECKPFQINISAAYRELSARH